MDKLKGCMLHETDDWKTPKKLYEALMSYGFVDCFKFQDKENELLKNYRNKKLWVNPPYSQLRLVTKWIIDQVRRNNLVFLLIPARTDTKYFHELIRYNPTLFFIQGRLKFNESKNPAPFPSIIMAFNEIATSQIYMSISIDEFIEKVIPLYALYEEVK